MPYSTRHGFGYSVFECVQNGISTELTVFVATDAPVKFNVIKIRNHSGRSRRLSMTGFFELVLGSDRAVNLPHIVTEVDPKTGGLFARNAYNNEFSQRVAFLDVSEAQRSVSGDRVECLGRNGNCAQPACMTRERLSGRVGAGLDACLSMQVMLDLADGQEREIAFTFGSGRDLADARTLVTRFHGVGAARNAIERVWSYWSRTLGTVNVQTPDTSLNFLANGWLLYQVMASRLWGRSGFYQSGGAFGFRDQLQDVMALVHNEPALLREQILRCAARQFREGDVQHWWHPPQGRGVRTHISDDYLWLPFATCRYVAAVGDTGVLDEKASFLEGRAVNPDEDSYYDLPSRSEESGTVYEHCVRAIRHGLRFGAHGLPLMGSGDWNDGMNLVGEQGKGESVWLAFFLYDVLVSFSALARRRSDVEFAELCASQAANLREQIERHAWDGGWYLRAFFDDGQPLGSSTNTECQIDSLPQSWSVLSGAGEGNRARQALAALDARLVKRSLGIIRLFDPPFDKSPLNPGYVKGYVPGVRENGGQLYARCDLDRHGLRCRRGRGAGVGTVRAHKPGKPRQRRSGDRQVQGRTIRGGRRRVREPTARGPGRVDLVHRVRRMDVPSDHRVASRDPARGRSPSDNPSFACGMAGIRGALPVPRDRLSHPRPTSRRRERNGQTSHV